MPSPFPGMDPYIERRELWPDFHDSLIAAIRGLLQPVLRPRYAALTQDRLYVVEADRPVYPDVALVRTHIEAPPSAVLAVPGADAPTLFELWRDEIREPVIHIIEPAANNRVVTTIEVLSPDNKTPGDGREAYLQKREEMWRGGANLVEIDLLRGGAPMVRLSDAKLKKLKSRQYIVAVTRRWPPRQEVYATRLQDRLPRIAVPLSADDRDVVLDLQAAVSRCWEEGPYPELLRYDGQPPGTMKPKDFAWCIDRLRAAGFRP